MNQEKGNVNKLTMLGMMTALVFVSNYLRITMPIAIGGRTSFTLANIMCCLSGLLLGPVGGVASGVGSALYDLTNPAYAPECWITLITKGIMGLAAGLAMADREEPKYGRSGLRGLLHSLLLQVLRLRRSADGRPHRSHSCRSSAAEDPCVHFQRRGGHHSGAPTVHRPAPCFEAGASPPALTVAQAACGNPFPF